MKRLLFLFLLFLIACSTLPQRIARYHVVKEGDSIDSITRHYGLDALELIRVNRLEDPSNLQVGQQLYLPYETKRHFEDKTVYQQGANSGASVFGGGPKFAWPSDVKKISSYFGWRKSKRLHEGIDIVAPRGSNILASANGKVIYASSRLSGYGRMLIVDHGNDWYTLYAHADRFYVRAGQHVLTGQKIGAVGRSGRVRGVHLHFEIRKGSDPIDPLIFLK